MKPMSWLSRWVRPTATPNPTVAGTTEEVSARLAAIEAELARMANMLESLRSTSEAVHALVGHAVHSGYGVHEKADALGQSAQASHQKTDRLGEALHDLHLKIDAVSPMLRSLDEGEAVVKAVIEREIDRLDRYLIYHLSSLRRPD